jgi:heat shock protein 5
MLKEAEDMAEEDLKVKGKIESRNGLEHIYTIRSQVNDKEKLGKKIIDDDKETILDAIKDTDRFMTSRSDATKEEIDEQKSELEAIVNPITTKLYGESGGEDERDADDL